jgi:predicted secreted hydrolase
MNADRKLSRRAFAGGLAFLGFGRRAALAQAFAGLSEDAAGFARVTPGIKLSFPADLGPHPDFRIEWWYVTANLTGSDGTAFGAQWTLFRQALAPGAQQEGWANQQLWMGHAAVTRADAHRFAETFARGGVGQAGVDAQPFRAWIDAWQMRGLDRMNAMTISPLEVAASGKDFDYALRLEADRPLVLQGDGGYSRKSAHEQASYYYSQPFFKATGRVSIDGRPLDVRGLAWMDREWSSQPLASNQPGWDWLALHLESGEKLMLYRMRQTDGQHYISGNWILPLGGTHLLTPADVVMTPKTPIEIEGRWFPVRWEVAIPSRSFAIECMPLNPRAWMGTSFAYWEGPIHFRGSHTGVGYLEMTGY